LFSTATGELTDVSCALPLDDRKRIDQLTIDLFSEIPYADKAARRAASLRVNWMSDELQASFVARETNALRAEYAGRSECCFDPPPESTFRCPRCRNGSMRLNPVQVIARCKAECGHEYRWLDSEDRGCPNCGYRPHAFRTESEERFAGRRRTVCYCPCSTSTDCVSHQDGFCPKCGSLPDSYVVDDACFCGMHHELMLPYFAPGNFLFIESESRWVADRFPNAKHWGDAPDVSHSAPSSYCASCESDHRHWRQLHVSSNG